MGDAKLVDQNRATKAYHLIDTPQAVPFTTENQYLAVSDQFGCMLQVELTDDAECYLEGSFAEDQPFHQLVPEGESDAVISVSGFYRFYRLPTLVRIVASGATGTIVAILGAS